MQGARTHGVGHRAPHFAAEEQTSGRWSYQCDWSASRPLHLEPVAIEDFHANEIDLARDPGSPLARVYLTLGLKEWVGAIPREAWLAEFEVPESALVDLRAQVESIVDRQAPGHVYRETRSRTSWGADSGEVIRAVLFVATSAASGIIGNAMYDLLRRFASFSMQSDPLPMTEDEAVERAKWIVTSHFANDVESLNPVSSRDENLRLIGTSQDRVTGTWTVTCRDTNGSQFVVELGLDGLPAINKISWSEVNPS